MNADQIVRGLTVEVFAEFTRELEKERDTEPRVQLVTLMRDPRAAKYFGKDYPAKLAALGAVLAGANLSQTARVLGIPNATFSRHALKARKVFGLTVLKK